MKAKTKLFNQLFDKEKCVTFFIRYGYFIHSEKDNELVMRKSGTEFAIDGEKFPKELTILFNSQETKVSLKYDTFVLFDTGDLQDELNLITDRIEKNINKLI